MNYLTILSTLFIIGSVIGWVIEVFYRRFFSAKKWVNPGFLTGPYIPIYGTGVLILFFIMMIDFTKFGLNIYLDYFLKILIIGVSLTLIELIVGLILKKFLHIKLWDYSNRKFNFQGIICPTFSIIWLLCGVFYALVINPLLVRAAAWLSENSTYDYFIGFVIGMMFVDFCYSLNLGLKVKKASKDIAVKFDYFKQYLKESSTNKIGFSFFNARFLSHIVKRDELFEEIEKFNRSDFFERIKKPKTMKENVEKEDKENKENK